MERGADPIITTLTIVQQLMSPYLQVLAKVGDNQVLLQSIKGSAYYDAFGDRASAWERRLTDLDEVKPMITRFIYLPTVLVQHIRLIKVLHNMNTAQRKWVSLEPYQEQMKLKQNTGGFNYREVAMLNHLFWMTKINF